MSIPAAVQTINEAFDRLPKRKFLYWELSQHFPEYILHPVPSSMGKARRLWFLLIRKCFELLIWIKLKPRPTTPGDLDVQEVDEVYAREAKTYNRKHHFTTRGQDLVWRRQAGWFVATLGRKFRYPIRVLDLCTGTGLTIQEMEQVAHEWKIEANFIGLDYNQRMLKVAYDTIPMNGTKFIRSDVRSLPFKENAFEATTMVFGVGGIDRPLEVFKETLRCLIPSGQFLMTDIHRPIRSLPGEWPFLKWHRFASFEEDAYQNTTLPLVLKRLWGWRDPTLSFYLLPLTTYRDEEGLWWGFEVVSFEQESQRWWLSLPLMPVARVVVQKTEIDEYTALYRQTVLSSAQTILDSS